MLGGGLVMTATGTAIWLKAVRKERERDPWGTILTLGTQPLANANETGLYISMAGMLSSLASIPLIFASGKNKRKAARLSFGNEQLFQLSNKGMTRITVPSIQLSLKF